MTNLKNGFSINRYTKFSLCLIYLRQISLVRNCFYANPVPGPLRTMSQRRRMGYKNGYKN